jgi:hypothetical protein
LKFKENIFAFAKCWHLPNIGFCQILAFVKYRLLPNIGFMDRLEDSRNYNADPGPCLLACFGFCLLGRVEQLNTSSLPVCGHPPAWRYLVAKMRRFTSVSAQSSLALIHAWLKEQLICPGNRKDLM